MPHPPTGELTEDRADFADRLGENARPAFRAWLRRRRREAERCRNTFGRAEYLASLGRCEDATALRSQVSRRREAAHTLLH